MRPTTRAIAACSFAVAIAACEQMNRPLNNTPARRHPSAPATTSDGDAGAGDREAGPPISAEPGDVQL